MAPSAIRTMGKVLLCSLLLPSFPGLVAASQRQRGPTTADEPEESSFPDWTYRRASHEGERPYSPSDWEIGYPDCGGDSQSPINLSANVGTLVEATEFNLELFGAECASKELDFEANGHVWEIDFSECTSTSNLSFDGGKYSLLQMHIHSPSEHMVAGSLHDAEIHLVHSRDDSDGTESELLVIGVFLDAKEHGWNVALEPLWDVLGSGAKPRGVINPYELIPSDMAYSHYMGSLTTPPCSEIVRWVVMSTPTVIGDLQLDIFRDSVATATNSQVDERSNTNRPGQAINGRAVYIV
uniref:Carbonic anhydrase n=1 Tax=Saccharina japonica TaxID=88149 RepID=A0A872YNN4_SACJA|nr:carbonic anhydrase alpha type [Saccharina japonica]QOY24576.1 carbonic anhydrase alpha type [Saccharina japonica]